MNLIEQLGGYEKAGDEYEKVKQLPESREITIKSLKVGFAVGILRCALLQYRREHNIFAVGDKIIFSAMCNSVMYYNDCLEMFISQGLIRHATPEEIKANKREVG